MAMLPLLQSTSGGLLTAIILLFVSSISSSVLAHRINCTIEDLPSSALNLGNVFLIETNNSSMQLSLRCRCSFFTPYWNVYKVESQSFQRLANGIKCFNTTNPDNETTCEDTVLEQPKPNIILENSKTFHVNESTILMCYSTTIRQTVVISMISDNKNNLDTRLLSENMMNSSTLQAGTGITSSHITVSSQSTALTPTSIPIESTPTITQHTAITSQIKPTNIAATTHSMPTSLSIVFTTTTSLIPTSELDITIGRVSTAEKVINTVGIPGLVGIPVIIISLLLNFVLISWIVCLKRKRPNDEEYIKQLEVEGAASSKADNSSRLNSLESNHIQSTDRLLSLAVSSRSRSNIYSTPHNFNNNSNNNNNNYSDNGNAGDHCALRTSQSDIVISNYSVLR